MNKHKSNKVKENSNTVGHLIMGQIITTQNLVAIKVVRHAGQQDILFSASELKGTQFASREDFPAEIRSARGELWDEFKSAKSQNLRARIVYPAKLVVDGRVVRDMFPEWGQWAVGGYVDNQERGTQIPRSGTPIDIPIGDLIGRIPFQQAPCPHNLAQHPMQTPPAGMLQAPQHPQPVPLQSPPAPLNPASASSHPSPAPLHAPPTPMHPPPLPLHPPPNAVGPHMAADGTNNADTTLLEIAAGTTASSAPETEATEGEPPLDDARSPKPCDQWAYGPGFCCHHWCVGSGTSSQP